MSDEDQDVARRRDEAIKRMFATPPKKRKGEPKPPEAKSKDKPKKS